MTAHSGEEALAMRVLHVEDNAGDVRLVAEALRKLGVGLEVYVVPDGSQAMEFLRRDAQFAGAPRPDLILLDLNLPRKGGREILAEIKCDSALKTIPVVVLSTSNAPLDIAEAYQLRANCYVTKAVDLWGCLKRLARLLSFGCNWQNSRWPPPEPGSSFRWAMPSSAKYRCRYVNDGDGHRVYRR